MPPFVADVTAAFENEIKLKSHKLISQETTNTKAVLDGIITDLALRRRIAVKLAKTFEEKAARAKADLSTALKELYPALITPPGTKNLSIHANNVLSLLKSVRNGPKRLNQSKLVTELIRRGVDVTTVNDAIKAAEETGEPQELFDILYREETHEAD
jgi:hypothetical protein